MASIKFCHYRISRFEYKQVYVVGMYLVGVGDPGVFCGRNNDITLE